VGLAVSDPSGTIAQGLDTLLVKDRAHLLSQLKKIIPEYGIGMVVVGLPLTLNGRRGKRAQEVQTFIQTIQGWNLPVIPWDERMSTQEAHRALHQMGRKPSREKGRADQISAILILQGYLDFRNQNPDEDY